MVVGAAVVLGAGFGVRPCGAAPVVTLLGGYPVLHGLAAGCVLLASVLVRRIRGVA